jgi:long-chain fatty acid transport protein
MTKRLLATAVVLGLCVPVAQATNGYFSHGYGTKSKALAGAGVALPQDAMAAAVNPAGMVHVGERLDVGLGLFSPPREYTQNASQNLFPPGDDMAGPPLPIGSNPDFTGTVESERNLFLIPHFGYVRPLDEVSSFGITVYGNGGMNSTYDAEDTSYGLGTFGAGSTGVDFSQLFVNLNYSRQLSERLSLGGGLILGYQGFKAKGLASLGGLVADGTPDDLTNNGRDHAFGIGGQLGLLWQVNDFLSLGASYQSKIYMQRFDDYSDLFAEQGRFDVPANATIGLALRPRDDLTLLFDVQRIWYSDVPALGNAMSSSVEACFAALVSGGTSPYCLGADEGAGFGWSDMTIYKLGLQWQLRPDWTLRFGYSKGDQPVPTSGVLFNVLAPAVSEQHFTFGFTKQLDKSREFSLAFMYAPENDLDCGCTLPLTGGPGSINIAMEQYELEASFAWRW